VCRLCQITEGTPITDSHSRQSIAQRPYKAGGRWESHVMQPDNLTNISEECKVRR